MANDLAIIEPPQLPDRSNPAQVPSLPAWLQRRVDALGSADQDNYRPKAQLPASLNLSSSERALVEQHIAGLERFLDLSQPITLREKVLSNDQAHGVMIAALLMKKGARLDAAVSEALTEDYLDAIEDLPAWCVREAIRKWNRAESPPLDKKPHDFNWRPEPGPLRRLAFIELCKVKGRVVALKRILNAEWIPVFTADHRREMLLRLQGVLHSLGTEPVEAPEPQREAAE